MKKIYIIPSMTLVNITPVAMVAESITKGSGEFDSGSMKYARQDNGWGDIWGSGDEESVDEEW